MRALIVIAAALALALPAARAQQAGAYETLTAADAATCARRCAGDGLCMSWLFRVDGACELRAIGLPSGAEREASGYASRAPSFLRTSAATEAPAPPAAIVEADEPPAPPAEPLPVMDDDLSAGLLGGPDDARSGIRPRLRN